MGIEKLAEAIVGFMIKSEGPNLSTRDAVCDCEGGGDLEIGFEKVQSCGQK